MKKKVLSLILAGTMTLGLALTGCSGGSDNGGSDSDGGSTGQALCGNHPEMVGRKRGKQPGHTGGYGSGHRKAGYGI